MGSTTLELGSRTWIMAVLNRTPDSFYPQSRSRSLADLLAAAERALSDGADMLDCGGESTRPGAEPVPERQEQERLIPALAALREAYPKAVLSADTRHAATAHRALDAGADIINDVSGLADPAMPSLLAGAGCGVVLMHCRGEFSTMHRLPPLANPAASVLAGLALLLERATASGVAPERCALDPGLGFGKNLDENFPVLTHLDELTALGRPLLLGASRKSFLRRSPEQPPEDRLSASLAAAVAGVLAGAHIIRTHDVAASVEAVRIADRLLSSTPAGTSML